jgi:hypothetical protein
LWAETVLRELCRDGLIYFFRSPWDGDHNADADNEALRLRPEEVEDVLASDEWRTIPLGASDIWFVATDKAKETYYSLRPEPESLDAG